VIGTNATPTATAAHLFFQGKGEKKERSKGKREEYKFMGEMIRN